jgi:GSH-dependent disulfide-bond oxidoreductase
MIDYYTAKSLGGNTRKITIMLAETGLPHVVYFVDLNKKEQLQDWYRAINKNCKIPAIVDRDIPGGFALSESGAVLVYLAEKTGQFLPATGEGRARVLEWVFWQASALGPMAGQWDYFWRSAPQKVDFAIARYRDECARLLGVLERQLGDHEYVAGDYSIADMMLYSWVLPVHRGLIALPETNLSVADLRHIPRWLTSMRARPAVELAMTRYEGTALRVGRDVEASLA